jgi:membrane protease subunit HflK
MRVLRYALVAAAGVAAAAYLLTGVVSVRPGERAVVRRFGRVLDDKPGPGLWVGLPWGMDRVDRVSVDAVRRVKVGFQPGQEETPWGAPPGQLLTGDHNLVDVQVVVAYRVREADVADYVLHRDEVDALVARVTEGVLAEWVAGRTVDDVLLEGQVALPRVVVEETGKRLGPYRVGVEVQQADVAHLFPPANVKEAFDNVARAQTGMQTATNEAEQKAAEKLNRARSDAYRVGQQAAAYAHEQKLRAEAEAKSFEARLEQYRRLSKDNPDFLRRVWFDEVGTLLGKLKEKGQVDLLDQHLSGDGLDLTLIQPPPKK